MHEYSYKMPNFKQLATNQIRVHKTIATWLAIVIERKTVRLCVCINSKHSTYGYTVVHLHTYVHGYIDCLGVT